MFWDFQFNFVLGRICQVLWNYRWSYIKSLCGKNCVKKIVGQKQPKRKNGTRNSNPQKFKAQKYCRFSWVLWRWKLCIHRSWAVQKAFHDGIEQVSDCSLLRHITISYNIVPCPTMYSTYKTIKLVNLMSLE